MRALAKTVLLALGLVVAGLALRWASGGTGVLLHEAGAQGRLAFVLAATVLCAVGVPRQIAAYAGAYAFGLGPGMALALVAQVAGCTADLLWARILAREWTRRRLGTRLARIDAFLAANPFPATLMLRLLPVGNNLLLNLLAGISGIAALPFLAASTLGYLPQTIVFGLLGAGSRIDGPSQIGLGIALFAASAALGLVLLRRVRGSAVA
ncbi:MAG: VTT domain-containing protein [Acidisphaera sp.]|nr:VTT domain-containing protein [Acidisphaera sp.]